MGSKSERRISIVLRIEAGHMCGHWWDGAEEIRYPVTVSGEDRNIPWSREVWTSIFSNIQLNRKTDSCRVLLYGQTLDAGDIPELSNSWEWTLEEISGELFRESGGKEGIGKWNINGTELSGGYDKLFPAAKDGNGVTCCICTAPVLEIPKASERHTPLSEIIQILNEGQRNSKNT